MVVPFLLGGNLHCSMALIRHPRILGGTVQSDTHTAEYWRKLEADARAAAGQMTDKEAKGEMLAIAKRYALLADRAEKREQQDKK
jgi:hypothetical protein